MRKDNHEPVDVDQLKKLKYESSDIPLPVLGKTALGLFAFIGVSSAITWVFLKLFVPVPADVEHEKVADTSMLAPGLPVLQAKPKFDMLNFRLQEEAKTDQYGYVDKAKGLVHVPIDITIEKIAASGKLPSALPGGVEKPGPPKPTAENTPSGTLPVDPATAVSPSMTPITTPPASDAPVSTSPAPTGGR
ncbi:MAG: hypothetical protein ABJA67_03370 [Chthonomonadales bacterium]